MSDYVETFDMTRFLDRYAERMIRHIDAEVLKKVEADLARFGYVKVVRCRDCVYYDGEPDMESLDEKCWRDPNHTGHSTPTVADGYCWRGKRKEGGE